MEQGLIRLLKAEEIECRISVINEKGLSLFDGNGATSV